MAYAVLDDQWAGYPSRKSMQAKVVYHNCNSIYADHRTSVRYLNVTIIYNTQEKVSIQQVGYVNCHTIYADHRTWVRYLNLKSMRAKVSIQQAGYPNCKCMQAKVCRSDMPTSRLCRPRKLDMYCRCKGSDLVQVLVSSIDFGSCSACQILMYLAFSIKALLVCTTELFKETCQHTHAYIV